MFELVDFRHCDFTIAALSLTFVSPFRRFRVVI